MRVVIVNWTDTLGLSDIGVVLNEDGTPQVFDSVSEAMEYAEENLNGVSAALKVD